MRKIIDFLRRLDANNNREWFAAHKDEYLDCKERFDVFTAELIAAIREFDDSIGPLEPKDCTYRIYRDTRFSRDKTPYKTHFGAYVVPQGKKSGFAGYYFQVGALDSGYPGGCMLATGDYICDQKVIRILREDIELDDGAAFQQALEAAPGFVLDYSQALKRVPAGFPAEAPWSQYLRLKNFCLCKEPGHAYMEAPGLVARAAADFASTKPFLSLLNQAIAYAADPD